MTTMSKTDYIRAQERKIRDLEKMIAALTDENAYLQTEIIKKDALISTVKWWRLNVCAAANTLLHYSQNRRILDEDYRIQVVPLLTDVSKTDDETLLARPVPEEEKLAAATFVNDNEALILMYNEKLTAAEDDAGQLRKITIEQQETIEALQQDIIRMARA